MVDVFRVRYIHILIHTFIHDYHPYMHDNPGADCYFTIKPPALMIFYISNTPQMPKSKVLSE